MSSLEATELYAQESCVNEQGGIKRYDFRQAMQSVASPMEQRREALEVILGGINVQCNKRSPLVFIKNK